MRHYHYTRVLYITMVAVAVTTACVISIYSQAFPAQAYSVGIFGVGGRLVPAALPLAGDGDILNFPPDCFPVVNIIGPEGENWGAYQWGVVPIYDYWTQSYALNAYPYTHADEYMLGEAVFPNPDTTCPLPLLFGDFGDSLLKAPPVPLTLP